MAAFNNTQPLAATEYDEAEARRVRDERQGIKREILKLIEPYRASTVESTSETPFTLCEMIVMAVLCIESVASTRKAIFDWLAQRFAACRESVLTIALSSVDQKKKNKNSRDRVIWAYGIPDRGNLGRTNSLSWQVVPENCMQLDEALSP